MSDDQRWWHRAYRFSTSIAACLVFLVICPSVNAATLPAGFTETQVGGLSSPTAMELATDGRLFVCQQGGQLRVIKSGALLSGKYHASRKDQ
jgi:hypothetical protein